MIQIHISQKTIDDFCTHILGKFANDDFCTHILGKFANGLLTKKNKEKLLWEISLDSLDDKLRKEFGKGIDLEALIRLDYQAMKELVQCSQQPNFTETEKDYFLTLYARLNKADFIKNVGVQVCPYCNRNYISNFKRSTSQETTGQLDHFFNKKDYPYLAVSVYNLIPSCSTCNQRKSKSKEIIFHPYTESLNDSMKFKLKLNNCNLMNTNAVEIECKKKKPVDKTTTHLKVFNIEALYQNHKDIALELIQKEHIYNESYIDELFHSYEGTLFRNREDVLRLITGGYVRDEELNKRPLSKLVKDISEELDLL